MAIAKAVKLKRAALFMKQNNYGKSEQKFDWSLLTSSPSGRSVDRWCAHLFLSASISLYIPGHRKNLYSRSAIRKSLFIRWLGQVVGKVIHKVKLDESRRVLFLHLYTSWKKIFPSFYFEFFFRNFILVVWIFEFFGGEPLSANRWTWARERVRMCVRSRCA